MLNMIGIIVIVGLLCQLLAWKSKIPAIVILLITGFIIGPVLGWLNPTSVFGDELIFSIVELSVALILFDGAMQLKMHDFKLVSSGLKRILSFGVLIHFCLISLAAYFVLNTSLAFGGLISGILIVTGPTVILPALREAKVNDRISNFLKWEGILTDPVGAIVAIVIYDAIVLSQVESLSHFYISFGKIILISGVFSVIGKYFVDFVVKSLKLPEFLQIPFITSLVIFSFTLSNQLQHGSGLLTVTILGMMIGNSQIEILFDLRTFKENITTMCISFVFIIIASSVPLEALSQISSQEILFVILIAFVLRPLAIFISTFKSRMSWQEKAVIGFYGPRGIVAASVAAAIGAEMNKAGIAGAESLFPIIFLVIITTVIGHGLMLNIIVKALGLKSNKGDGILFIGTLPIVYDLALKFKELGVAVKIASASWHKLAPARNLGLSYYYGQVLSHYERDIDEFRGYKNLFAISENDSFNKLACETFSKHFGKENVFHIERISHTDAEVSDLEKNGYCFWSHDIKFSFEHLQSLRNNGWKFKHTTLTLEYDYQKFLHQNENSIVCFVIKLDGHIRAFQDLEQGPQIGDTLISFSKKEDELKVA